MKTLKLIAIGIVAAGCALPKTAAADELTNRFTFSALFGFNVKASFKGLPHGGGSLNFVNTRTTLDGDAYNYDDGYVLVDSSGNAGDLTWYWGYDNKANQFDSAANPILNGNNSILMHRSTPGDLASPQTGNAPYYGAEVGWIWQLVADEKVRFGLEIAGSYMGLNIDDNGAFTGSSFRTPYENAPVEDGTEPPPVSQSSGSWDGRKGPTGSSYLIDANFSQAGPISVVPNGTLVAGSRDFNANIWGMRLGPIFEFPIGEKVDVTLFAGMAAGWLNGTASWSQTVSTANGTWTAYTSGSGSNNGWLWGGYAGAGLVWRFHQDWSLATGARYQNMGKFSQTYAGQQVDVNFKNAVLVTFGFRYSF